MSQESEIRVKGTTLASEDKEYGSGREGDVADNSRDEEKDNRG